MLIGIRPTNDFAFKKTFGSPANKLALISLLNAILELRWPIVDVTIENPYNLRDFQDDKLSILDIKAVDQAGAIYDIEMQLTIFQGLVERIVFYGCEIYAGQLAAGDDYLRLRPVFSICLIDGILWKDAGKVHHSFRLTDKASGRTLDGTLEIHTLELGRYNLQESDLATASMLDCWLYWLLHAHEYEPDELMKLLPQKPIQQATQTITQISLISEDKTMYDAREKAIRDQQWALNASFLEGASKGKLEEKIAHIQILQSIMQVPVTAESELLAMSLEQLDTLTTELQRQIANRLSS